MVTFVTSQTSVAAPTLDAAIEKFLTDSFTDTDAAIADVVGSGAPQSSAILDALSERRLLFSLADKAVVYKDAGGKFFDARTGGLVAAPPADAQIVRLNNRLRGTIAAAIGTLTLLSPDPAKRLLAAESVFKSRDAASLPALEAAMAVETVPNVKRAFASARASALLAQPDADRAQQVAAVATLAERGDQDAMALLRGVATSAPVPEVKQAAEIAMAAVERKLRVTNVVQNVYYGLSLGSVLLLAAIGLAITFGVMGVINMAHGEMVMLGAYTTFAVQEGFRAYAPTWFNWSLPVAIPLAFLVSAVIGIAIERGIIRFLYGRPLDTLLATWGVSLILQQAVRTIFGSSNREVGAPSYMSGAFEIWGLAITYGRMWIIVFTLVLFAALLAMLKLTPLGLQMRAVTQNRRMAGSMGIRTNWIDAMTFALGSGIAGIAGVALSQIDNVSPNLGQSYIIDSFMVVVFGGVGNLWGTFVSAFALGITNKLLEPFAGAVLGKILILVALILFIQKRPSGLFALKGRAVDAMSAAATTVRQIAITDTTARIFGGLIVFGLVIVPVFHLWVPASSAFHLPTYVVALIGKYVCFAILALALDLVWGYCGILSLGHGAFFALGGYVMGMYLMRQIGTRGVYANPVLPDFMVFLNYQELPWFWNGFHSFPFAFFMIFFVPGLLALAFGWLAFRSRVTGVYLSIITQALTYALLLAFFRNDMGLGGNNGLTDFKDIVGFNVQAPGTRAVLCMLSLATLLISFLLARRFVDSSFGKVLIAIRDTEQRTRFLGYRVENYKLAAFVISAMMAGVAGALYVPQVGIINPSEFSPANSIEAVIWAAVGGRGTLVGAAAGAVIINALRTWITTGILAPYWLFVLGTIFIVVPLVLPKGIIGALLERFNAKSNRLKDASGGSLPAAKAAE